MIEITVPDPVVANEWSLVLHARGIQHELVVTPSGIFILLDEEYLDDAWAEIEEYEAENRALEQQDHILSDGFKEVRGAMFACLLLFASFSLLLSGHVHQTLITIGANEAEGVLDKGQLWRPVTALTLHRDPSHLLSNMVIGGVFMVVLIQLTGAPLAWSVAFLAGVLGNVFSLFVRGHSVASIGASTAVFGVLGAMTGILLVKSMIANGNYKRPLCYLGTGLALLSFLGTGDEFTDRTAHLTGFLAGGAMGVLIGIMDQHRLKDGLKGMAFCVYLSIIIAIIGAWYVGIRLTGMTQVVHHGLNEIIRGM